MYFNGTNEEIRSRIYGFFLSVRYICIDRHTDELNVLVRKSLLLWSLLFRSSDRKCSVKKGVLSKFSKLSKFQRKNTCIVASLIKLQACNFIKKRFQHSCLSGKFAKLLYEKENLIFHFCVCNPMPQTCIQVQS